MAEFFEASGRRKESTARVRLTAGSGAFVVNEKPVKKTFPPLGNASAILSVLEEKKKKKMSGN